jgi:hypothetical protein
MADPPKRSSIDLQQEIFVELNSEQLKDLELVSDELECRQRDLAQIAANIDFKTLAELVEADLVAINAALGNAVALTPMSQEERSEFVHRFSTDPKGLGLTNQQVASITTQDWLEHYRDWEHSHLGRILATQGKQPKGKAGRPPEEQTRAIHTTWVQLGRPTLCAPICDKIAKDFFGAELRKARPGSKKHKRIRERVRQAIRRCEQRAAT